MSGPIGQEVEHYRAPKPHDVPREMELFLSWLNLEDQESPDSPESLESPSIKAAIAHLWFVLVHPFDDGNGRLARLISTAVLSARMGCAFPPLSLATEILKERQDYYHLLDLICVRESLDVTDWVSWYLTIVQQELVNLSLLLDNIFVRRQILAQAENYPLNARQKKVLSKYLDNFQGQLTPRKYQRMTKCPASLARQELAELVTYGLIAKESCSI